jgi:hypothetical protein
VEEPARHFLAGADFGECSILVGVQINLESFLVGPDFHLRVHEYLKV